jgi:hypothetical protein
VTGVWIVLIMSRLAPSGKSFTLVQTHGEKSICYLRPILCVNNVEREQKYFLTLLCIALDDEEVLWNQSKVNKQREKKKEGRRQQRQQQQQRCTATQQQENVQHIWEIVKCK